MPSSPNVTIYFNPACGTARKVLAMIRDAGIEPEVINYLIHPPTRTKLKQMIKQMGLTTRDLVRRKGDLYTDLQLDDPALSDDQLLDAMLSHPALIERPIVVTPLGTRLCRPPEAVLAILPAG